MLISVSRLSELNLSQSLLSIIRCQLLYSSKMFEKKNKRVHLYIHNVQIHIYCPEGVKDYNQIIREQKNSNIFWNLFPRNVTIVTELLV